MTPATPARDDLPALLAALPPAIRTELERLPAERDLIEVVLDLGRPPEARFGGGGEQVLLERDVDADDLQYVIDHIGSFGEDNRAGIERTLHRISAIRNRNGKIVGLTCRIGRAVFGTIEIIEDLVESGRSVLIMGRPGIGKTTMLREAARVLADDLGKRVVIVDTSNEIAGDGDIPHPGIGGARRMQVPAPVMQHHVMIEAVENHMPEVIVIDEIGTELEAAAARTIAERGVQLIGTAHGNNLDNLMLNPTLSDLIGGIQTVTLGDEEARRRRSQKSVLERKAPPTFDVIIEIQARDRVAVHADVAETVDAMLRGDAVPPELRWRDEGGVHRTQARPRPSPNSVSGSDRFSGSLVGTGGAGWRVEPGWRAAGARPEAPWLEGERAARPGFRPSGGGGWRAGRGRAGTDRAPGGPPEGPANGGPGRVGLAGGPPVGASPDVFQTGEIADRGPARARHHAGSRTASARRPGARPPARVARVRPAGDPVPARRRGHGPGAGWRGGGDDLDAEAEDLELDGPAAAEGVEGPAAEAYSGILPTLHVLPFGISRKRLEQAVRELQLPVVVARTVDDADVVITLRSQYRQKPAALREAEERTLPIYVLKSNTVLQMEACLTSLYALQADPREAAMRETEEAIGLVMRDAKPIELSPQNAYIRRLQHQMAERANLVSRSRGREPFRRVRLYPDQVRAWR